MNPDTAAAMDRLIEAAKIFADYQITMSADQRKEVEQEMQEARTALNEQIEKEIADATKRGAEQPTARVGANSAPDIDRLIAAAGDERRASDHEINTRPNSQSFRGGPDLHTAAKAKLADAQQKLAAACVAFEARIDEMVSALHKCNAILGQMCELPAQASQIALSGNTAHVREVVRALLAKCA